eukprot:3015875-Pyramimonas_sp.AAC.1
MPGRGELWCHLRCCRCCCSGRSRSPLSFWWRFVSWPIVVADAHPCPSRLARRTVAAVNRHRGTARLGPPRVAERLVGLREVLQENTSLIADIWLNVFRGTER